MQIRSDARYGRALDATIDLLSKLRFDFAFVGEVARGIWLERETSFGAIDVLVVMGPEAKNQIAMMASNRGFRVERTELEQAEELDLIPLWFVDAEGDVRIHVLIASNALYGRMVAASKPVTHGERQGKVVSLEDLVLMLLLADDERSIEDRLALTALPAFDTDSFNEKVRSIGLSGEVIAG